MPPVDEALRRLEKEIGAARREKVQVLKVIHGYGSSGQGGDIRAAVQRRLRELTESGEIRGCIFGEHWSTSSDEAWQLLQRNPELKNDADLGRRNLGMTIVLL